MKTQSIQDFLKGASEEKLSEYLSILLEKTKDVSREVNLISLYMVVLVVLFSIIDISQSITVGPFTINDKNTVLKLIPIVFGYLIIRFQTLSSHKAEMMKIIKAYSFDYFKYNPSEVERDALYTDDFTRLLLPVSMIDEVNKLNFKTKSSFLWLILIFPLVFIVFIPYAVELYWIIKLVRDSWADWLTKTSVVVSAWLIMISMFYFFKTLKVGIVEK